MNTARIVMLVPAGVLSRGHHTRTALALVLALVLALAVGAIVPLTSMLNADVAWYVTVARLVVRDGARLYVDVLEINPPLVMWLLVPPVALADALGITDPRWPVVLLITVELAASLVTTAAVLRAATDVPARTRGWLLVAIVAVLTWPIGHEFGQREHQVAILLIPYLLLAAWAGGVAPQCRRIRVAAGVLAGVGIAFKPHFVLAALLFEGLLAATRRQWPRPRPELVAAAVVVLAYGVAILAFAPHYIDFARTWLGFYAHWATAPTRSLVLNDYSLAVAGAVLAIMLGSRGGDRAAQLQLVFALAAVCLLLVAFGQRRGWPYHYVPALVTGLLSAAIAVWRGAGTGPARVVAAGVLAIGLSVGLRRSVEAVAETRRLRATLVTMDRIAPSGAAPRRGVALTTDIARSYPLFTYLDVKPATPFPSFWYLYALRRECRTISPATREQMLEPVRATLRAAPELVLLDSRHRPDGDCGVLWEVVTADPEIAALLGDYTSVGEIPGAVVYVRQEDVDP